MEGPLSLKDRLYYDRYSILTIICYPNWKWPRLIENIWTQILECIIQMVRRDCIPSIFKLKTKSKARQEKTDGSKQHFLIETWLLWPDLRSSVTVCIRGYFGCFQICAQLLHYPCSQKNTSCFERNIFPLESNHSVVISVFYSYPKWRPTSLLSSLEGLWFILLSEVNTHSFWFLC